MLYISKSYGGSQSRQLRPNKNDFAGVAGDNNSAKLMFAFPPSYAMYLKYIRFGIEIKRDDGTTFVPEYALEPDNSFILPIEITNCGNSSVSYEIIFKNPDGTFVEKSLESALLLNYLDPIPGALSKTDVMHQLFKNTFVNARYEEIGNRPHLILSTFDGSEKNLTFQVPLLTSWGKIRQEFLPASARTQLYNISEESQLTGLLDAFIADLALLTNPFDPKDGNMYMCIGDDPTLPASWKMIYSSQSSTEYLVVTHDLTVNGNIITSLPEGRAVVTGTGGALNASEVTATELGALTGISGNVQTQLGTKVDGNAPIAEGTFTKITYDTKGLVTGGTSLVVSDLPDLSGTFVGYEQGIAEANKTLVTDATGKVTLVTPTPTAVHTLNGEVVANPSWYAPVTAGTLGQIVSANATGIPVWSNLPAIPTVVDVLTSHSIADALSANMGRVLNEDIGTRVPKTTTINDKPLTGNIVIDKADVGLSNVDNTADLAKPVSNATQTALDGKVDENAAITAGTHIKITYDTKGLVTAGSDLVSADIPDLSGTYLNLVQGSGNANKTVITDATGNVVLGTAQSPVVTTLNGVQTNTPSWYAPVANGTTGQILYADANGAPTWEDAPQAVTVEDALNSTSTTNALSANMGRILNEDIGTRVPKTTTINDKPLTGNIVIDKADVGLSNVDNTADLAKPISNSTQTALDGKVDENAAITAGTHTKITYDSKGLVTDGADLAIGDVPNLSSLYVSNSQGIGNANKTVMTDAMGEIILATPPPSIVATLNGAQTATPAWYAPLGAGISGQILQATGGVPNWIDASSGISVTDNLDSTSATDPLSANMGRTLNVNKVDKTTTINLKPLSGNIIISQGDVGLDEVDNTSDLDKPISTATQDALDLKLNKNTPPIVAGTNTKITYDANGLVTAGGSLIASDIPALPYLANPTGTKEGVVGCINGEVQWVTGSDGQVLSISGGNAHWENVSAFLNVIDNLDSISSGDALSANMGRQLNEYINARVPITRTVNAKALSGNIVLDKSDIGLGNVDNTTDLLKPISTATQGALDTKVNSNTAITAGTNTKITYDAKGLVTEGTSLVAGDIPDLSSTYLKLAQGAGSANKAVITDASGNVTIGNAPSSIIATLNGTQTDTPSWYSPLTAGTSGQILQSTGGAPIWVDEPVWTFDSTPTQDSTNPVISGGIYNALQDRVPIIRTVNAKALSANIVLDKNDIGLGNVENTADLSKPISTATQTALNGKVTSNADIVAGTHTKITYDVKGLVTAGSDLVSADIPPLPYLAPTDVVDNVSGFALTDRPLSAKQGALLAKYRIETVSEVPVAGASRLGHSVMLNTDQAGYVKGHIYICVQDGATYAWENLTQTLLGSKVDKIAGMGLSSNDYTIAEKTKLASVAEGAEVNVNADWNAVDGDAQILNKPTLGSVAGRDVGTSSGQVPILNVNGKLPDSVIPPLAIGEYAGSVPTKAELVTLTNAQEGDIAKVTADSDIDSIGVWFLNGLYSDLTAWIQIVGPGAVISVNGQTGVVTLSYSDVGAVPTTRKVNNKPLSSDISLGASDVGAVPTTRKVNNKALSADVILTPADVGAVPPERTVNEKPLSADVVLTPADIGAVPPERTVNGHALSSDVVLDADDVGAVEANAGIVTGTFTKVTVDIKGLVTLGEALDATDIPPLPASKIGSGTLNVSRIPTGNAANKVLMLTEEIGMGQSLRRTATGWEPFTPSSSHLALFTGTITGDGTTRVFTLNHGLSGIPVVTLYEDGEIISTTVVCTSSTIQVTFYTAPAIGDTYTIKAIA